MADEEIKIEYVTRKEAIERGVTYYFTGKPCKHGHIEKRYICDGACCKCANIKHRKKYHKDGGVKGRERARRYREKNPNIVLETVRKYRKNNRDLLNKKSRILSADYRNRFPEKAKAAIDRWWKNNPGKKKIYHRNRKARKRGNGGSHTFKDIDYIRRMQKDKCAMPSCRIKLKGSGEVDHIVALAKEGSNDRRNLQILCGPCNRAKRDADQTEFLRRKGFLL